MIRSLLQKIAHSFRTILITRDVDGNDGSVKQEPYLYRTYLLRSSRLGSLFLHRMVASDRGPEIHNHPWALSVSLILLGGYEEERLTSFNSTAQSNRVPVTVRRWLRPLALNWIAAADYHRIILPAGKEAWTLFYHTPTRVQNWGFLYPDGSFEPVLQRSDEQRGNVVLHKEEPVEE